MQHVLHGLNDEQQGAVMSNHGVTIIQAGPGTGKTKTLIARMLYLIKEKKVDSTNILSLTFTRKAAAEMRERLQKISKLYQPVIGTFHSVALGVLSEETLIQIASEQKRTHVVYSLHKTQEFAGIPKREILRIISLYKSRPLSIPDRKNTSDSIIANLVSAYNDSLKAQNLCDYDDILIQFYELLNDVNKLQTLQKRFKHILVDEFQDTNEIQYQILRKLSPQSLFIIGDPLQSIYSFRGADSTLFGKLKSDYPNSQLISLPINYRSAKQIVNVSSFLFPNQKKLSPFRNDEGTVSFVKTYNEYAEAEFVLRTIGEFVGGTDLLTAGANSQSHPNSCFGDFAVIYRNHHLSTIIQEKLFDSGIPYQVVGEDSPWELPEIQFIFYVIHSIYNKSDHHVDIIEQFPFATVQINLETIFNTYVNVSKPSILIQKIVQDFRLMERLKDDKKGRLGLLQFQQSIECFDTTKDGVTGLVNYIKYLQEHEYYEHAVDKVTLLTMHASKGLEFKHVFICGFEEGIIPSVKNNTDLEEEKRLLYVALTRAKDSLHVLYTGSRNKKTALKSRFMRDLSLSQIQEIEDSATEGIKKKMEKAAVKKSQLKIF